ncbi:MAG: hypothetical protein LBV74_12325 [Tannerella sp.]|jgi:hypothetical protein|nr:hypothetical protein [Tannerella sp.]
MENLEKKADEYAKKIMGEMCFYDDDIEIGSFILEAYEEGYKEALRQIESKKK